MRYWVGVTDNGWFNFLSQQQPDEVNFWHPSGKPPFTNLEPGALFLFKVKSPHNHVAGGGHFVKFSSLPLSMVWETFGAKNGAASRVVFETMIRSLAPNPEAKDPDVGCSILTQPFFWPRSEWIAAPLDWASNNVRGRYYDTQSSEGAKLWAEVQTRFEDHGSVSADAAARYGEPMLVKPRLGQGAFRVVVTDAYARRCAITGERTLPVLEAAHILPFAELGPNEISNGLLLRSDFHKLFDLGLITVTPQFNVEVSPKIKEQWFNGKAYYSLHGQRLANIPTDSRHHPDSTFLSWHNENRFQE